MYMLGQEIEYSNGILAQVVATRNDGHFIILKDAEYAACYYDLTITDEEVWVFIDEANPFKRSFTEARSYWPRT